MVQAVFVVAVRVLADLPGDFFFPVPMFTVPLHSGYLVHAQKTPEAPLRCEVFALHNGHLGPSGTLIDKVVPLY